MLLHANAKLGLAGRFALVRAVEDGLSLKAAAFKVSPRRRRIAGGTVGKPIHDNGRYVKLERKYRFLPRSGTKYFFPSSWRMAFRRSSAAACRS
jgi:hypothetical protein